jgi:hypothetical protein
MAGLKLKGYAVRLMGLGHFILLADMLFQDLKG